MGSMEDTPIWQLVQTKAAEELAATRRRNSDQSKIIYILGALCLALVVAISLIVGDKVKPALTHPAQRAKPVPCCRYCLDRFGE